MIMEMQLKEIAKDVHACLQPDKGIGTSNAGLINSGDGLAVDTFWDLPHTRKMIELYAGVRSEPVKYVVNTHENGDHIWGNQLFEGAEIIASQACADAFGISESPEMLQAVKSMVDNPDPVLAGFAKNLAGWDFTGIELTKPSRTFDEELTLNLDGIGARLIMVGPAHTPGDVIVYLPERGVVFAGDVVFSLCTPVGWQGSYEKWFAAMDLIIEFAPDVIVPGHGPLCGIEGAREFKAYLQYVRQESKTHFDAGLSSMDACKKIDLGPYADWTEPERLFFNVERAYREFRGESWDTPVDAMTNFKGVGELRAFYAANR
ncbi:MAG: MBL fold metallo-hydrolase [Deltaproteobacteria bacterium]|nr:MBL fold metallo-hydrolase [Deltaproteobacteria bacterium]